MVWRHICGRQVRLDAQRSAIQFWELHNEVKRSGRDRNVAQSLRLPIDGQFVCGLARGTANGQAKTGTLIEIMSISTCDHSRVPSSVRQHVPGVLRQHHDRGQRRT